MRVAPLLLPRAPSVTLARSSTVCLAAPDPANNAVGSILEGGAMLIGGTLGLAALVVGIPFLLWLWQQQYVLSLRRQRYNTSGTKSKSVAPDSPGYIAPREMWTLEELSLFDGRGSDDGPILLAADGLVFNVARGRNFYGPGGEYEVMAGADATRYLARNSVESETEAEAASPLNLAQRGALATWVFSLKSRYDIVGKLASEEEEASMRKREEYMDRLEAISADFEREQAAEAAPPPPRQRNPYLEEPRLREWLDEQEEIRATEEARERLQKMWNSPDVDVDES